MTWIESELIRLLKTHAYGIDKAMSAETLAKSFLGISTRKLRQLKRHMVLIHHKPIGSTTRGYFWAVNDHELMKMANYYDGLICKSSPMKKEYLEQVKNKTREEMF